MRVSALVPGSSVEAIVMHKIPWAKLATQLDEDQLQLVDGSRVGVIGGGPAGSFFGNFLLDMAARAGLGITVDIYEPRDFSLPGPTGCNMCGGIISESLVQTLAVEGIVLSSKVVERGIDSYQLHMDVGSVCIETPLREKRIASVHRGSGPLGIKEIKWSSLDGYLLQLATNKGANVVRGRVDQIQRENGQFQITIHGGSPCLYDLLVVAVGVNTSAYRLFEELAPDFHPPRTTKTFICEYYLGEGTVGEYFGSSMHVFLLNIPRVRFAAIIPKGDCVLLCLLGDEIDDTVVQTFLHAPIVRQCFPPELSLERAMCHCLPRINIKGATRPFADNLVFVGDCAVSRLYKDGIGAAYRTAKTAAATAVFEGISAKDFERYYWPVCRSIELDNSIGKFLFGITGQIQKWHSVRWAIFRMIVREQQRDAKRQRMSTVLWDLFTGSAPYREVFLRTLHPAFWSRFLLDSTVSISSSLTSKVRTTLKRSMYLLTSPTSGEDSGTKAEYAVVKKRRK